LSFNVKKLVTTVLTLKQKQENCVITMARIYSERTTRLLETSRDPMDKITCLCVEICHDPTTRR